MTANVNGDLLFGHILAAAGLDPAEVILVRHTYTAGGLQSLGGSIAPEIMLSYTRRQDIGNKLGKNPPRYWIVFMADSARRSRLHVVYENFGEILTERAGTLRYFDLRPSPVLSSLVDRLVIEWTKDAVNWAKTGAVGSALPVVEIADPEVVPFPGFDRVLITYPELQAVISDSRYSAWRIALASVQGIYLIADKSNGQLYVGKADGGERILGRWSAYARDGHGGNIGMRRRITDSPDHAQHFQFSILRVFGPSVPKADVDDAEAHFKNALLSRQFGLNLN